MPKANERPLEELKERTMVNRPRLPRGLSSGCFGLIPACCNQYWVWPFAFAHGLQLPVLMVWAR